MHSPSTDRPKKKHKSTTVAGEANVTVLDDLPKALNPTVSPSPIPPAGFLPIPEVGKAETTANIYLATQWDEYDLRDYLQKNIPEFADNPQPLLSLRVVVEKGIIYSLPFTKKHEKLYELVAKHKALSGNKDDIVGILVRIPTLAII